MILGQLQYLQTPPKLQAYAAVYATISFGSDDVIKIANATATTRAEQTVVTKFLIQKGFNTIISIEKTSASPPPRAIVRRTQNFCLAIEISSSRIPDRVAFEKKNSILSLTDHICWSILWAASECGF
jgi:hypothetical protein